MSGRSFECLSGSISGQRTIQGQASGKNARKRWVLGAVKSTGLARDWREAGRSHSAREQRIEPSKRGKSEMTHLSHFRDQSHLLAALRSRQPCTWTKGVFANFVFCFASTLFITERCPLKTCETASPVKENCERTCLSESQRRKTQDGEREEMFHKMGRTKTQTQHKCNDDDDDDDDLCI